jgi:hypothetical protein
MPLSWQTLAIHNMIGTLSILLYYLNMISGGYQSPTLLFIFIFISFLNINFVTT